MSEDKEKLVSPTKSIDDGKKNLYTVEPYRWVALVAFILCSFANGNTYVFFSSIMTKTINGFKVPVVMILMCTVLYGWIYPISSLLLANYIIGKYSANISLILGGGCVVLYCWVRGMIVYSFPIVLIGAVLGAIGQPLILNCIPIIATKWFGIDQRALATTLASLANPVGNSFGLLWPALFVKSFFPYDIKRESLNAVIFLGILCTICVAFCWIFFRERPKRPPSPSAEQKSNVNVFKSMAQLLKSWNFVKLLLCYVCICICNQLFSTIVNMQLNSFGFGKPVCF